MRTETTYAMGREPKHRSLASVRRARWEAPQVVIDRAILRRRRHSDAGRLQGL